MPFFRSVHCPAVLNSILLYAVARDRVPRQFQPDEVRHHAAAREIAASLLVIASQVGKPAHGAPLHGHGSRTNRVGSDILIEGGADEIGNDSDGIGRWRDQPHVTWVPDMRAIGKKFL